MRNLGLVLENIKTHCEEIKSEVVNWIELIINRGALAGSCVTAINLSLRMTEYFLTHRQTVRFPGSRPVPRGTGRQHRWCNIPKAVYTVKNCSWVWENLWPEISRTDLKRLIIRLIKEKLWIFFVAYIIVLLMYGHIHINCKSCMQRIIGTGYFRLSH